MSEEILKGLKATIKKGEKDLEIARDIIAKLKTAGEDVSTLERQYSVSKARLDRFKRAFG